MNRGYMGGKEGNLGKGRGVEWSETVVGIGRNEVARKLDGRRKG